ncbi:MAG: T9SS type A sorting domain-containing protein, partial [Ignavibacteriae bacterium]|nr:T9SS type A sorting domain-containing protein [Ignavibacteriota bacterium]
MKLKISVVILFIFTFYLGANSQVKFTENFDYTAGDSIGNHGWVAISGTTNNIKVVSPGLTYTDYPLSGIGNAARLSNNGIDASKSFTTGDSVNTGFVYASFLVKIDSGKTGDYFFTMNPPTSNTTFDPRVLVKDSSGTLSFGLSKGPNAATPTYGANGFSYGTTLLVVVKYKFNTGSTIDDELFLYVFSSGVPSTEPTTPYLGPFTSATTDISSISKVVLRQGSTSSAPSLTIDGIKVATSWTGIVSNVKPISTVADKFVLSQNYPNPFNPVTNINFSIPTNGNAKLSVYNALGQQVQSLLNGSINSGTYSIQFDGKNLNSGLYFYKLELSSNDGKYFSDVKKLMLVK